MALRTLFATLLTIPTVLIAQHSETGFLNRTVQVGGAAYRYQVYVPAAYDSTDTRWPVILFLHGAGERGTDGLAQTMVGLADAIRHAPARYPAIVVMPQAPPDSIWVGAPSDAAVAALDRTMREFRTDPDRVYLTGLSLGGNGTWNLAYRYPDRFAAIAPVCGFISALPGLPKGHTIVQPDSADPFAIVARRLGHLPVWIFHGEMDPVVPVAESRKAAAALRAAGNDVRYTEFPGGTHFVWDLAYGSQQFADWLFAQRRHR